LAQFLTSKKDISAVVTIIGTLVLVSRLAKGFCTMHMTARMRVASVFTLTALSLPLAGWGQSPPPGAAKPADRIKAFCIDFNWGPGGPNSFSAPGTFAHADPKAHYQWYKALGANTIMTHCVSCDGYAWYRASGVAPVEPGLKHDFLKEITELAHKDGMRVMGYFCVGANTYWGQKHPDQSYGIPSAIHIPFTNEYLDYLTACIKDVLKKTDIDGFQLDWAYSPPLLMKKEKDVRWLECEGKMYAELFGRPFPGRDKVTAAETREFQRRALDRCWGRIHEAAKSTRPNCIIWLSCYDLRSPQVAGSRMFREVDWIVNEHPDPSSLDAVRKEIGPQTKIVQCICGWGKQHDPRRLAAGLRSTGVGFLGFAKANPVTTLPPKEKEIVPGCRDFELMVGNARNIEILRDVFHDKTQP
jgi:hypothetical protein